MLIVKMYVISYSDHDSLNYWNGLSKSTWSLQIMSILRLIEPVARLSISCHVLVNHSFEISAYENVHGAVREQWRSEPECESSLS